MRLTSHRTAPRKGARCTKTNSFSMAFFVKAGLYFVGRIFPELPRDFKKLFKVSLLSRKSGLPIIEKLRLPVISQVTLNYRPIAGKRYFIVTAVLLPGRDKTL